MNDPQNIDRNAVQNIPITHDRDHRDMNNDEVDVDVDSGREPISSDDVSTGAQLGGVGGIITGAIAGAALGPLGAVGGAVIGGVAGAVASAAAVSIADQYDNDYVGNANDIGADGVDMDVNRDRAGLTTDREGDLFPNNAPRVDSGADIYAPANVPPYTARLSDVDDDREGPVTPSGSFQETTSRADQAPASAFGTPDLDPDGLNDVRSDDPYGENKNPQVPKRP